jgi:hypothetical protein
LFPAIWTENAAQKCQCCEKWYCELRFCFCFSLLGVASWIKWVRESDTTASSLGWSRVFETSRTRKTPDIDSLRCFIYSNHIGNLNQSQQDISRERTTKALGQVSCTRLIAAYAQSWLDNRFEHKPRRSDHNFSFLFAAFLRSIPFRLLMVHGVEWS